MAVGRGRRDTTLHHTTRTPHVPNTTKLSCIAAGFYGSRAVGTPDAACLSDPKTDPLEIDEGYKGRGVVVAIRHDSCVVLTFVVHVSLVLIRPVSSRAVSAARLRNNVS